MNDPSSLGLQILTVNHHKKEAWSEAGKIQGHLPAHNYVTGYEKRELERSNQIEADNNRMLFGLD